MGEPTQIILAVLLAEDNELDAEIFTRQLLIALPDSVVTVARSEAEVYIAMREVRRDLIVLDLNLRAGGGGIEMVSKVRTMSESPIIVLTGNSNVETAKACIRAGADAYFLKDNPSSEKLRLAVEVAVTTRETYRLVPREGITAKMIEDRARMDEEIQQSNLSLTAMRANLERVRKVVEGSNHGTDSRRP